MSNASRLDTFRAMVAKSPNNALARFGLANEAMKAGLHEEAAAQLETYLGQHEDEGNGWQRLAECRIALGRDDEAREALARGIAAARRFGHAGLVAELEERLEEIA
ncbi:MAG: tetratricopeptide repeat protein [Gemmatimonadaceae bacterium]|nr:tetratricopeptide repeat protein [Gemmatimonadaceae bacterium]NUQ92334.1 tetratricopeptide repeat protein [Gemmatimonadaceae bacterium]NUS98239.1 tetratricopeptide repeat protein [Gemmatimonadaceae bacterium]